MRHLTAYQRMLRRIDLDYIREHKRIGRIAREEQHRANLTNPPAKIYYYVKRGKFYIPKYAGKLEEK